MTVQDRAPVGRWVAFRHRGYPAYWTALLLVGFAVQIQTVAIGWQVYDLTRDPFDLGLVGLSQFAPALLLVLVTGAAADRFSRRGIMCACLVVESCVAAGLLTYAATLDATSPTWPIFALILVFGAGRAFYNPARQSLAPNLVPPEHLSNAILANSTANQAATICGPVVGGLLYGLSPGLPYAVTLVLLLTAAALVLTIPRQPRQIAVAGAKTWETLSAGFRYIWASKPVLGAISLDLFAVLLGGAMAMLPVYARDVLEIGPTGLGLLRSAPAVGAIGVGFWLMAHPIRRNAGLIMFLSVAAFGFFTLVFALSTTLWLSALALLMTGAFDMVSVNLRSVLIQLWTPDALRGRVNSVNQVFIGASNELGAFRAGTMATLIGPVAAVALGGAATLAVAALWARLFPDLRRVQRLD
ncbi:MFS transporter [Cereibacter changlensis JA139]|uniref:MFS transporter n=2 Tax=Cereibacter changlensis TaxID=402884 RepID=A0A2T4JY32_9RHOB|nr:MFS transporter [Cereibacter changlensis]PTE22829.1 MFS transporter [Cereibacter changlensis JA139]PZX58763.1 putative MFS family arabinose efflux permease [Cereibacter changlensis]